jgi:hypothetical protein
MTFPRVYKKGAPKTFARNEKGELINIDYDKTTERQNRVMPTEQEIEAVLLKADKLDGLYFQLRAKALVSLVKIFGKRRGEITRLCLTDLTIESTSFLYITFTLEKKYKRGFAQYVKYLERYDDQQLTQPYYKLQEGFEKWQQTKEGSRTKNPRVTKGVLTSDKFAQHVITYWEYMKQHYPKAKFLFPSGKTLFGKSYIVNNDKALSGQQLLNIAEELDPSIWLHLYRKLKGSQVAKKYGRTLDSAYQVKEVLNLEKVETALVYVEQNCPRIETGEAT